MNNSKFKWRVEIEKPKDTFYKLFAEGEIDIICRHSATKKELGEFRKLEKNRKILEIKIPNNLNMNII